MEPEAKKPASSFELLPTELHLRIRNELLRDPDTTFSHLKPLRLVCRVFDHVWSPIIFASIILLFSDDPVSDEGIEHLRQLTDGDHSSYAFQTVTLKNWHHLNTAGYHFYNRLKNLWIEDRGRALIYIPLIIILFLPVNLVEYLCHPKKIPRRFKTLSSFIRARYCANLLPRRLHLPNVCSVKLIAHSRESRWVIYRRARVLAMLPALTELELCLPRDADMAKISKCLNPLRNLRKFTLRILFTVTYIAVNRVLSNIGNFSTIIARNPNLTHLVLRSTTNNAPCDLSSLLRGVPADKPLMLEHVTIDGYCRNLDALLPHIQSLSSIDIQFMHFAMDPFYTTLERAGVFPSTITADALELDLFMYLNRHPGIVRLSIGHYGNYATLYRDNCLPKILERHSGTLQYLTVRTHMLRTSEGERALSACKQLRELVLTRKFERPHLLIMDCSYDSVDNEIRILPTVARLNRSLTVVIRAHSISAFRDCIEYCKVSNNPLVCDLAGRIVYERLEPHGL